MKNIDKIEFADGTVWDRATAISKALVEYVGTDDADYIKGENLTNDWLKGFLGNFLIASTLYKFIMGEIFILSNRNK